HFSVETKDGLETLTFVKDGDINGGEGWIEYAGPDGSRALEGIVRPHFVWALLTSGPWSDLIVSYKEGSGRLHGYVFINSEEGAKIAPFPPIPPYESAVSFELDRPVVSVALPEAFHHEF